MVATDRIADVAQTFVVDHIIILIAHRTSHLPTLFNGKWLAYVLKVPLSVRDFEKCLKTDIILCKTYSTVTLLFLCCVPYLFVLFVGHIVTVSLVQQ